MSAALCRVRECHTADVFIDQNVGLNVDVKVQEFKWEIVDLQKAVSTKMNRVFSVVDSF